MVLVEQGASVCAGALVAADRVLTAWHCVAGAGAARVTLRDGGRTRGRLVGAQRSDDVALLALDDAVDAAALPLGPGPVQGQEVRAWGHPYGASAPGGYLEGTLRWSRMDTVVSAVGTRALQLDSPLAPGMSGGPVVDGDGRLVGVVSRRLGPAGPGFATRVTALPDERPVGPGVVLSLRPAVGALDDPGSPLTVSARGEAAIGGLFVVGVEGGLPPAGLSAAQRWGSARFVPCTGTAAVRYTFGRGASAVSVEAIGGAAVVAAASADGLFDSVDPTYLVGAGMAPGVVRAEVAWLGTGDLRLLLGIDLGGPRAFLTARPLPP